MPPRPVAAPAWPDLLVVLPLTDAEAAAGGVHAVMVPGRALCGRCAGRGSSSADDQPVACEPCKGRGLDPRRTGQRCRACDGLGRHMIEPCGTCEGRGVADGGGVVTVTVPAGASDGAEVRLVGAGGRVGPGQDGDLIVRIEHTGAAVSRPEVTLARAGAGPAAVVPRAELVDPAARRASAVAGLVGTALLVLVGWLLFASV